MAREQQIVIAASTHPLAGTAQIDAAGLGIACVTRISAQSALQVGRVAELPLQPTPTTRPVHLIHRRGRVMREPSLRLVACPIAATPTELADTPVPWPSPGPRHRLSKPFPP
ncbi:LysR substrate-binding domain-containing protein [Nocardia flavorosea]|uniref:LysR substrate-binding domain-containing protein n=1 Tax=Nocardia flavorosea TaxID=53429 RepID=A0A846YDB8_9NOCA|nr:LysR substrate-binding domain-containing protein [Nocardia flavorosea]NKY55734.1 hypothetical protein [Nocardia flavorosea]